MTYHVRAMGPAEGIPGKVFTDPGWILRERVAVVPLSNGSVRVSDMNGFRGTDVRFDGTDLTFNGERVDVGDDFIEFLGLLDEASGHSAEYVSEPYED